MHRQLMAQCKSVLCDTPAPYFNHYKFWCIHHAFCGLVMIKFQGQTLQIITKWFNGRKCVISFPQRHLCKWKSDGNGYEQTGKETEQTHCGHMWHPSVHLSVQPHFPSLGAVYVSRKPQHLGFLALDMYIHREKTLIRPFFFSINHWGRRKWDCW